MDSQNNKMKALSKEETKCLVTLVGNSRIINNKATNATTNKLKNVEWIRITEVFNAMNSICRRTPQQLRMKWENLKKNSRKRSTMIRMNHLKTGGGAPSYIPPDEILDQVSSLLGSTVEGFIEEFGGDAETEECFTGVDAVVNIEDTEAVDIQQINNIDIIVEDVMIKKTDSPVTATPTSYGPKKHSYIKPSGYKKTQKKEFNDGRRSKNIAIAEYYTMKKKCLEADYERILLENQKLKLEIEELKNRSNSQETLN